MKTVPIPEGGDALIKMMQSAVENLRAKAEGQGVEGVTRMLSGFAIDRDDCGRILVVIGRKSVNQTNLSLVEEQAKRVVAESLERGGFGKLLQFSVDGYTEDTRGLWDIPEVVSYFKSLHEKTPYLLFWMGKESVPLYCRILTGGSPTTLEKFLKDAFFSGIFICERMCNAQFPDDPSRAKQLSQVLIEEATKRIRDAMVSP